MNYSTSFPATENPISEGGVWWNGGTNGGSWTDIQTISGLAHTTRPQNDSDFKDSTAILTTGPWGQNQVVEVVVYVGTQHVAQEIELRLNTIVGAAQCWGYEVLYETAGTVQIIRWDSPFGTFAFLTAGANLGRALVTGDVLKAERVGGTLNAYFNGALVATVNDSTYTAGAPGFGLNHYPPNDTTPTAFGLSDFSATDGISANGGSLLLARTYKA